MMTVFLRKSLAVAVSAGALAVAPALISGGSPLAAFTGTTALAAGNGNGHGGDHGGGNGGGHGNAGGNGGGHAGGFGADVSHGHSGQHGAAGGVKSIGDFVSGLFGTGHGKSGTAHGHSTASWGGKSLAHQQETALHGKNVPVPTQVAGFKDKNLHAKLGWLNSLQRNYHAYLNAQDPKFAPIQAYVLGQAQARVDLANAQETYASLASYYNDTPVDTTSQQAVEDRLSALQNEDTTGFTQDQLDARDAEISALTSIDQAYSQMDDPNAPPEDQAGLVNALETATNSTTVDPGVLDWSAGVLSGKISDVESALQSQSTATTDTTTTTATTTTTDTPDTTDTADTTDTSGTDSTTTTSLTVPQ